MYPMSCWDSPQTLDPVSIPVIYVPMHGRVSGDISSLKSPLKIYIKLWTPPVKAVHIESVTPLPGCSHCHGTAVLSVGVWIRDTR